MTVEETTLDRLEGAALTAWLSSTSADYVEERIAAGDSPEEAQANADATNARLFPGGSPKPGQLVGRVCYRGEPVGSLWVGPYGDDPRHWWVWSVEIDQGLRGQGHGRRAMLLAERLARSGGATTLGLNVFAYNAVARHLYQSLGYDERSVQMGKGL